MQKEVHQDKDHQEEVCRREVQAVQVDQEDQEAHHQEDLADHQEEDHHQAILNTEDHHQADHKVDHLQAIHSTEAHHQADQADNNVDHHQANQTLLVDDDEYYDDQIAFKYYFHIFIITSINYK